MSKTIEKQEKNKKGNSTEQSAGTKTTKAASRPGITLNIKNLHLHFDKCFGTIAFILTAAAAAVRSLLA